MILLIALICISNAAVLALLAGIAWYLHKIKKSTDNFWMASESALHEVQITNRSFDALLAFLKVTFSEDFAQEVLDIAKIKERIPATVKRICDDGEEHEVKVDAGF